MMSSLLYTSNNFLFTLIYFISLKTFLANRKLGAMIFSFLSLAGQQVSLSSDLAWVKISNFLGLK